MDGAGDDPTRRRRLLPLPSPRAPAVATDPSSLRRLPPVHPTPASPRLPAGFGHYQPQPGGGGAGAGGSNHARSLSQPQFLSMDFLFRPHYPDLAAPAPIAVTPPPSAPPPGSEKGPSGLPPLRAGHRRSQSDVLLAISSQPNPQMPPPAPVTAEALAAANNSTLDGILGAYMGPKAPVTVASAQERRDNQDGQVRAWSPADSSENEADSGDGGLPRHARSLSADSFVGKLAFGAMGLEPSNNLPPPSPGPGAAAGLARSGSGSIGGAAAIFAKEFACMGFSEADKKKIMESDHLSKIVMTDPKKVKRILNNRLSAAKSKERKARYIAELERKVQVLQSEATTLTSQVNMLQRGYSLLSTHNSEMKIRLQALLQQAELKDALNEALNSEVQRLKLVAGETSDPQMPNASEQQMSTRMIQLHQLLKKPSKDQQDQQQKWS
ncbi:bZIP transcription factor 29 [Lolium perenne]|uniref:bZIP transcription factor 29 n=1 Tax=Lolium perenne TaxID=4522 RepID=UPI0021F5233C|nr:bZIP transcription factor 29-like [Lolium perenne]